VSAETSVTVVGAGATGGYLAAQLAKAGVSVTLVARADSLRQIR
jgi:ketopantoate reductase